MGGRGLSVVSGASPRETSERRLLERNWRERSGGRNCAQPCYVLSGSLKENMLVLWFQTINKWIFYNVASRPFIVGETKIEV